MLPFSIMGCIAYLYCEMGRFEESEQYYKNAVIIRRQLAKNGLSTNIKALQRLLNNIADLYEKMERHEDSAVYRKEAEALNI